MFSSKLECRERGGGLSLEFRMTLVVECPRFLPSSPLLPPPSIIKKSACSAICAQKNEEKEEEGVGC